MPRFHFHVHGADAVTRDHEGRELADLNAARVEAIRGVRSILSYEAKQGVIDLRGRIEVTDGDARPA